jgi:hypothetical protein
MRWIGIPKWIELGWRRGFKHIEMVHHTYYIIPAGGVHMRWSWGWMCICICISQYLQYLKQN